MIKIRKLEAADIIAIKDDLVEKRDIWKNITKEDIEVMASLGISFTCLDSNEVIACAGGFRQKGIAQAWALYSNNASKLSKARAAIMFRKKLHEWKDEHDEKLTFNIPSDLPNSESYTKFLGSTFVGTEQNKLFSNVTNNLYEV